MKSPRLSHRRLLGGLLAALIGWFGACQPRTAAPSRQPAASSAPQGEERDRQATPTLQVDGHGTSVVYTYDDKGNRIRVQHSENPPAQRPARTSDRP
jgi:YD repeat-containing protein